MLLQLMEKHEPPVVCIATEIPPALANSVTSKQNHWGQTRSAQVAPQRRVVCSKSRGNKSTGCGNTLAQKVPKVAGGDHSTNAGGWGRHVRVGTVEHQACQAGAAVSFLCAASDAMSFWFRSGYMLGLVQQAGPRTKVAINNESPVPADVTNVAQAMLTPMWLNAPTLTPKYCYCFCCIRVCCVYLFFS